MTTTHDPPRRRNTNTEAARLAARASYARRRHAVWIAELRDCGVTVILPPNYTGLPIEVPSDQTISTERGNGVRDLGGRADGHGRAEA